MISLVIPCFNEQDVLRLTYERICEAAEDWDEPIEILLVDDGSSDGTWSIIESLSQSDTRVRGFRFSRNFGQQAALGAGFERARGEAVVVLDADLQDPPELVAEMILQWRAGYDVVYGRRRARDGESYFKKATASLFYRLLDSISECSIPRNTGDFALMDARVVEALNQCGEREPFWRALRSWTGFRQTSVEFDRPERAGGETHYTVSKMIKLAWGALLSFSSLPLRLPTYLGAATIAAALLTGTYASIVRLTSPAWPVQPTSLVLLGVAGVQMLCLGLIGNYLQRIYDETRSRPRWIVSETSAPAADAETVAPRSTRAA